MERINIFEISEIILPNDADIKRRLEAKLEEYRGRVQPSKYKSLDYYKMAILERLLTEGRVSRKVLRNELDSQFDFIGYYFQDAFGVIWAYANDRLDIIHGGTGLAR